MIINEQINNILGIRESYEMPDKLLSIMLNKHKRENIFSKFLEIESDKNYDWFLDYFQSEHGDRNKLKQDYTPSCLCNLMTKLSDEADTIYDMCAGVGGLTLNYLKEYPQSNVVCEELSTRAVSILLFSLSIRNVEGYVKNIDVLTRETKAIYKLIKTDKYSDIEVINNHDEDSDIKYSVCISNPPYSLKWNPVKNDKRFEKYGLAPKGKADYAFILHAINELNDDGIGLFILPLGVLFRGAAEEKIRKKLIQDNLIDCIIGLPEKLFANTSIPVFILKINKNKESNDILFINASEDYIKQPKQNDLSDEHINKIIQAVRDRKNIDRYSSVVTREKIEENDYNLNIPRYVSTYVPEPIPDLFNALDELTQLDKEIYAVTNELYSMTKELVGNTPSAQKKVSALQKQFKALSNHNYSDNVQLRLDI